MEDVTLDDGTVLRGKVYNFHAGLIRDYTLAAKNFLKSRLGRKLSPQYAKESAHLERQRAGLKEPDL
jgi:hypothetical protein